MGADEQLGGRRAALRAQLTRVAHLVTTLDDPTPDKRVQAALTSDVAELADRCDAAESWPENAAVARSIRSLAERFLELSAGMSARVQGLDDGLCRLADALLREVSAAGGPPWVMTTVPADADFFSERDHVIRVRWPGDGIWTLPLALHELGHYVGRRIEVNASLDGERWSILRPFEMRLSETGEEVPADWHHLHEFFADAYATYVGGPAYLACCVTIGLDPTQDASEDRSHPAPSRRVALILEILARMNACPDNSANLHYDIEPWRRNWVEAVNGAAGTADLALAETEQELADFLWSILFDRLRNARYRTLNAAKALAGQLLTPTERLDACSAKSTDVLNAVWCARHQAHADLVSIEERGRVLMEKVAQHG
jgi:hypothetical protein